MATVIVCAPAGSTAWPVEVALGVATRTCRQLHTGTCLRQASPMAAQATPQVCWMEDMPPHRKKKTHPPITVPCTGLASLPFRPWWRRRWLHIHWRDTLGARRLVIVRLEQGCPLGEPRLTLLRVCPAPHPFTQATHCRATLLRVQMTHIHWECVSQPACRASRPHCCLQHLWERHRLSLPCPLLKKTPGASCLLPRQGPPLPQAPAPRDLPTAGTPVLAPRPGG